MKSYMTGQFKIGILIFLCVISFSSCKKDNLDESIDQLFNSSNVDLDNADKKEIAMKLVSSAENSTLNWRSKYDYIQDINDGRGYTAGIIGFTSGTGDMLNLVVAYTTQVPENILSKYIPALKLVNRTESHQGLDPDFQNAWKMAATDIRFKAEQENQRDKFYFTPALKLAKNDGLHALGQFIYYDAAIVHGYRGLERIRNEVLKVSKTPSDGISEEAYLHIFLDKRILEMKREESHSDVSRIDDEQRIFLKNHNLELNLPLDWKVYGDKYHIGK